MEKMKIGPPVFGRVTWICLGWVALATTLPGFSQELSRSALEQIEVLLQEKQSRTPLEQKLRSDLLYLEKKMTGSSLFRALPQFETITLDRADERLLLDIKAEVNPLLLEEIVRLGGEVTNALPKYDAIRALVPLAAVRTLASRLDVRFLEPANQMMVQGVTVTEGDVAHRADTARTSFGVDGTGIKVGVMSDSVDSLDDLLGTDLPNSVTVLPGQSGNPGTSEGTALLEIVHDLAPGAELFFATAKGGEAQFAQNINDLAAAGCQVIVDDALYFSEGVFQDGVVAQAVDAFVANGGIYITSAGNSGNLDNDEAGVWEGDYAATALPAPLTGAGLSAHDFGGGDQANQITMDTETFFTLQWANPLNGAATDMDLFLLDSTLSNVIAASTFTQNGTQNPFEIIESLARDDLNNHLVAVLVSGDPAFLHLNTHRGRLEVGTDGQIFGHPGAVGALTTAAVNVATAGGGPFMGGPANPVEFFTSDGPRRIFFNADGSPVDGPGVFSAGGGPPSVVRPKPDLAAADGVSTSTPGFNPFFGTSASAPHIAGISALALDLFLSGGLNNGDIFDIFKSTALDIEDPGFDRNSGFGILDAENALGDPIFSDGFESGNTSAWTSN